MFALVLFPSLPQLFSQTFEELLETRDKEHTGKQKAVKKNEKCWCDQSL